MNMNVKQAESPDELLSYISKIERLDISPENYKGYLKQDFQKALKEIGDLGPLSPLVDSRISANMEAAALKLFRQELFRQAAVLRSHRPHLSPLPAMTSDALADISIALRQWCIDAIHSVRPNQPPSPVTRRKPMEALHNATGAVFINYSHFDNEDNNPECRWLDRFLQMLKPLVSQEELTHWSDQQLKTGDDWHARIQAQLNVARAAVLLVSPAFLASDYIRSNELPVLLKNASEQGVKIFPIIVRPCLYDRAKFKYPDPHHGPAELKLSSIQAANPPSRALSEMSVGEQDRVLLKVASDLHDLLAAATSPIKVPSIAQNFEKFLRSTLYELKVETEVEVVSPAAIRSLLERTRGRLIEYVKDLDSVQHREVIEQFSAHTREITNAIRQDPFAGITGTEPDDWMRQVITAVEGLNTLHDFLKRSAR